MTNDEAIKYLYKVYLTTKNDSYKDALSNAISALREKQEREENEPCEYCKKGFTSTGKSLAEYVSDGEYKFCPMCGRSLKGESNGKTD